MQDVGLCGHGEMVDHDIVHVADDVHVVVADENVVESVVAHVDNSHYDSHVNSYFILIGQNLVRQNIDLSELLVHLCAFVCTPNKFINVLGF